jgi:hypothetical protein
LQGILRGGFTAKSNLEFGYDTYGLSQWQKTGSSDSGATKLIDGFYVVDQPENELDLSATIEAGAGIDVWSIAGVDLIDVGEKTLNPNWQSEYEQTSQRLQKEYQKNLESNRVLAAKLGNKLAGASQLCN